MSCATVRLGIGTRVMFDGEIFEITDSAEDHRH